MEYFAFPEKFFFIDLTGLEAVAQAGFKDAIEVIFLLSDIEGNERQQRLELELSKKTFRLGCTPVVNLFSQVAEPIQLNQRKSEYPLVPDVRRPYSVEVFSVDEVAGINAANQKITTYEPFYSLRHFARSEDRSCFWLARRRPSARPNDDGTDIFLSLLDLYLTTADPDATSSRCKTTCTNRDLPARLPFGNQDSDFELEGARAHEAHRGAAQAHAAGAAAHGQERPVAAGFAPVAQLSVAGEEGKDALQEILRLYDVGRTAYSQNVIQSILQYPQPPAFRAPGLGAGHQLRARNAHRDGDRRRPVRRRRRLSVLPPCSNVSSDWPHR